MVIKNYKVIPLDLLREIPFCWWALQGAVSPICLLLQRHLESTASPVKHFCLVPRRILSCCCLSPPCEEGISVPFVATLTTLLTASSAFLYLCPFSLVFMATQCTFMISVIMRTILLSENQVLPNLYGVNYETALWEKRLPLILADSEFLVVVRKQKMPGKTGLKIPRYWVYWAGNGRCDLGRTSAERNGNSVLCEHAVLAPAEFEARAVTALPHNPVGAAKCTHDSWNLDAFFPNNDLLYWKKEV